MRNYLVEDLDIGALLDLRAAAQLAAARRRVAQRREAAAAKQKRRDAGLVLRHAAKLARIGPWGPGGSAT